MAQPMPRTSRDGAASADFKKERLLRSALRHRRSFQLPEDPKATTRARGGEGGRRAGPLADFSEFPLSGDPFPIPSLLPRV